ncbi:MAG: DUF362 domain-containing protein [Desulfobulbaceae bacterium]|nr:MAG: DUF362 domain-containing protein [Desulfobulbaceae bacterium]
MRTSVYLDFHTGYDHGWIKTFVDRFFQQHGPNNFNGNHVLLKPNLISSRGPRLACTDHQVIRATAEWFIDHGAQVAIGDSPAFGSTRSVLKNQHILEHLADLPIEIVEFKTPIIKTLSHGIQIGVSEEALACDFLVNLPRVKAHNQMYMTLAVKNAFGIVCGIRKAVAHMKNGLSHNRFGDLMLDLVALLPPSIGILDGIEGMHREGPLKGDLIKLGFFAASESHLGLDCMTHQLLHLDPLRSPVIRAARQRGLHGAYPDELEYSLKNPEDFSPPEFITPILLNPVPFNPFRFLASSFKRALMRLQKT